MIDQATYRGITLDGDSALALLDWQLEMGCDVPMLDAPVDRFDLPTRVVSAAPTPQAPPPPADDDDLAARVALAQALADGAGTLAALAEAQQGFDGIELKKGARNFCFADGNARARVMILSGAPDDEEDRQGRPFVGRAGQMLDRMFGAIGLTRDAVDAERAFYVANALTWCPPGGRDPDPDELAVSLPFLRRHIALAAPEVIVLMGNVPCLAGLERSGILRLRGQWGQAFGRPALPMTHPSYLLRNPAAKREAWADLLSLQARLESLSV